MLPSPTSSPSRYSAFGDLTNTPRKSKPARTFHNVNDEPGSPSPCSRRLKAEASWPTPCPDTGAKRANLFADLTKRPLKRPKFDVSSSDDDARTVPAPVSGSGARKRNIFAMRSAASSSNSYSRWNQPLPTRSILASFVSSHKSDIYRLHSDYDNFLTPPYACSFSHAAKRDGKAILAVSTEQGSVHLLDVSARAPWDPEPPRTVLRPHQNGAFDVRWSPSDTLLSTCSADFNAVVCDPTREDAPPLRLLQGHKATLKCVAWANAGIAGADTILATGCRDGTVRVWDIRVGQACIMELSLACSSQSMKAKGKAKGKRKPAPCPPPRSVTSLVFPADDEFTLIGSCSSDGILRRWDLRQPSSAHASGKGDQLSCAFPTSSSPSDPTIHAGSARPRGLNALVPGTGPTAGLLFTLGADARVHTYGARSLEPLPPATDSFAHPALAANSFFVRTALSPCGRWLATGSAGPGGAAFLFDVASAGRATGANLQGNVALTSGVRIAGAQAGEVGAIDFAAGGVLATCADEGTVRVWRPDVEVAAHCRAKPEDSRWQWAWAEQPVP